MGHLQQGKAGAGASAHCHASGWHVMLLLEQEGRMLLSHTKTDLQDRLLVDCSRRRNIHSDGPASIEVSTSRELRLVWARQA